MPHEKHQIWKRITFVERNDPFADVLYCSTALYARSPQFPFQHHDGFQLGILVDKHAKKYVIRVAVVVFLRDSLP